MVITYFGGLPVGSKGSDCDSFKIRRSFFTVEFIALAYKFEKSETFEKDALGETANPKQRTEIITLPLGTALATAPEEEGAPLRILNPVVHSIDGCR